MSGKLTPKPIKENPLHGWIELDDFLQSKFNEADYNDAPHAIIDVSKYEPTREEIMAEGEEAGYKITDMGDDLLKFE